MAQVSRPLLIALGLTFALMALWVVALRPKPVPIGDTPLAPTKAIPQAEQAAAISDAANAKLQAASDAAGQAAGTAPAAAPQAAASPKSAAATKAAATPKSAAATPKAAAAPKSAAATKAAATPKPAAATNATAAAKATAARKAAAKAAAPAKAATHTLADRRAAALARHVAHGKIVVLLFWNAESADDIATRGALRELDRHHGKVTVRVVPIGDAAHYASLVRGANVSQSPTTVVIAGKRDVQVIAGLGTPRELKRAVGKALRG
jgi:hypothetical protein